MVITTGTTPASTNRDILSHWPSQCQWAGECHVAFDLMSWILSFRPGLANNLFMDFCRALYSWPFCLHVCGKEVICMCLALVNLQLKGVRLDRTHLHLADFEAFWPAMRHAINFVRPLTQTAIAREEYGNLRFFCTTTKPRTSCFLLEYASENPFVESSKLLQDCKMSSTGKVQLINFELANECGEVLFRIHRPKMEV